MIVYHAPTAAAGSRWQPTQNDAKALKVPFNQTAVAENGRHGICDLLNSKEVEIAERFQPAPMSDEEVCQTNTPEAQHEATVRMAPGYQSPFSAQTVIAGIDSGLCAAAIRQMDGKNLAKIVAASIERMQQLAGEIA